MKLHAITLEGFWGYRESATVEIDGLPLLIAVGHNGSGKSALVVSAVLAGLYGKFPTRTVEESITHGSDVGHVIIEFEVGGALYRVARSYPRSRSSSASVHRWTDGRWSALVDRGAREATAKVVEILGMDYDTAIMTWVAVQGEYGAFATAQPSARFKMLATVFDLGKYGPMHRTAQEKLRTAKEAVATAQGRVAELNDSLIDDDARDGDQMSDDALAAAAVSAHKTLDAAAAALAAHQQNNPQVTVERARTALSAVKDVRLANLRAAEEALTDLRAARDREPVARDEKVADAHARFERDRVAALGRIAADRASTLGRITEAERELAAAEQAAQSLPDVRAALELATTDLAEATAARQEAATAVKHAESVLAHANAALTAAQAEVTDAYDALDVLVHEGDCYACGQHITESIARSLRTAQKLVIDKAEAAVVGAIAAREDAVTGVAGMVAVERAAVEAVTQAQLNATDAALLVRDIEIAAAQVERARAAIDRENARLVELAAEEEQTGTRLAAERETALAAAERDCEANVAAIAARGKQAAEYVNTVSTPTAEETQLEEALAAAIALAAGDEEYRQETERLTAERDRLRTEATTLDTEIGRRAEVARRQAEQGARIEAAKKALAQSQEDVIVFTDLVAAYAPSGIPSMVLEGVIDDLNTAINVTLASLSGGGLEVRLSTSRETAGGATESKVTVYVDTPSGPRSYEALSGGQRFRVDLAIRMGLATIISQGTGTPVETFILDEGWGSLDEAGIRSTLEVLGRLSEQVNVLTVSHVDAVRESFPARIEVSTMEGTAQAVVVR